MDSPNSVWKHLMVTVISVSGALVIIWAELPPDQRLMATLTLKAKAHRWLHRAARYAGQAGMGSELDGHRQSAAAGYGLAYRLANLRDRL